MELFHRFDDNRSGFLDFKELRGALAHYGLSATELESASLVRRYDDYKDGKLELTEFAELVRDIEAGKLRIHGEPPSSSRPPASHAVHSPPSRPSTYGARDLL